MPGSVAGSVGLSGSQNLLLAEPPGRCAGNPALTQAEVARGGAPGSCLSISQWQALPLQLCRLLAVLCPVLVRSPRSSTMNREGQLSSQSYEERTAADGSCLPAVTTEPQEKL